MKIQQGSSWRDVPIGGNVLEPGTSIEYETGSWRSQRPTWNGEICLSCINCWLYCPDISIKLSEAGKVGGVDYGSCKGCGLCAKVCPAQPKRGGVHAMTMERKKG
jgi:pyruvate ferredoxin oxidoreductase delta subunit